MDDPATSAVDWREPWEPAGKFAGQLEEELRRELGPRHPLRDRPARAIARSTNSDDVLFTIAGAEAPLAVVHLSWSGRAEADPRWPSFVPFADLADWAERRMIPDHVEFLG